MIFFKLTALTCSLALLLGLTACGYHNPNVMPEMRDVPPARIYAPMWRNATSELALEVQAHNAMSDWLAQSGRIILVADEEEADYVLNGRINSVRYPGFSYDTTSAARSLTAIMNATATLTERESDRIVWQNQDISLEETYNLSDSISQNDANKRQALHRLVDSLAEQVYLRVLRTLTRNQQQR
ncbi:LptE family protein [Desulfurivibrio dismutans]|uniref:LptE family protein n=1 Tax=Desulfurivibrio dismutans TaxID=1398908 RepID=UPI0023DAAEDD|nr:LptE family protein [Desulfurivibrio alkaliphilus]MDF1614651.1 LptE family protein [Desulfurivibrio alkaliphilus]